MPTVFCPPSVSALKTRTARYFSGSRAALVGVGDAVGLAIAIIGELLALVARLVLVSDRWQAFRARQSRLISKIEVKRIGVENLELSRAVRTVVQAAVFISFSEEFERRGSVNKRGVNLRGIVGYHAQANVCKTNRQVIAGIAVRHLT